MRRANLLRRMKKRMMEVKTLRLQKSWIRIATARRMRNNKSRRLSANGNGTYQ